MSTVLEDLASYRRACATLAAYCIALMEDAERKRFAHRDHHERLQAATGELLNARVEIERLSAWCARLEALVPASKRAALLDQFLQHDGGPRPKPRIRVKAGTGQRTAKPAADDGMPPMSEIIASLRAVMAEDAAGG